MASVRLPMGKQLSPSKQMTFSCSCTCLIGKDICVDEQDTFFLLFHLVQPTFLLGFTETVGPEELGVAALIEDFFHEQAPLRKFMVLSLPDDVLQGRIVGGDRAGLQEGLGQVAVEGIEVPGQAEVFQGLDEDRLISPSNIRALMGKTISVCMVDSDWVTVPTL